MAVMSWVAARRTGWLENVLRLLKIPQFRVCAALECVSLVRRRVSSCSFEVVVVRCRQTSHSSIIMNEKGESARSATEPGSRVKIENGDWLR